MKINREPINIHERRVLKRKGTVEDEAVLAQVLELRVRAGRVGISAEEILSNGEAILDGFPITAAQRFTEAIRKSVFGVSPEEPVPPGA